MLARALLLLNGGYLALAGPVFAIRPTLVTDVAGFEFAGADATTEARAVYGGMQLGLGLAFLFCANAPRWRAAGALTSFAFFGGLGMMRLLGVALDGSRGAYTIVALVWELGCAIVYAHALRNLHPVEPNAGAAHLA